MPLVRGWGCVAVAVASFFAVTTAGAATPVESIVSRCPTAAEVARFNSDFALSFENDPTGGTLVCTAATGAANLSLLQARTYQVLGVLRELRFTRPLPWTALPIYEWLTSTIDGIRLRSDIDFSFCCDPPGMINIQTRNSSALQTDQWISPALGTGIESLPTLFVHEARHNQPGFPHTCGSDDATIAELGAWGAQYYFNLWEGLYSGSFLNASAPYSSYYREFAILRSESVLGRICVLPSADLALDVRVAPTVSPGARVVFTVRVANGGPASAPEVYLHAEVPTGARFSSASASQGSCSRPAGASGVIGCALGSLGAAGVASVRLSFAVTARVGTTISVPGAAWQLRVTGPVRDTVAINNSASPRVAVVPAPPCPGTPSGSRLVGTPAADVLRGTRGNDLICGAGGDDRVFGLAGADVLRGDAGDDRIFGGPGRDRLLGLAGSDVLIARDRVRDTVACGAGEDVALVDSRDLVADNCERVRLRPGG